MYKVHTDTLNNLEEIMFLVYSWPNVLKEVVTGSVSV